MVCTITGVWVSNWKQWERSGGEGSWPQKKSQVEVEESDAELEGSGASGLKARGFQDITFGLLGIKELLIEQNGYLKRIAQSLDGGLGAGEEEEDSTIRE